MISKIIYYISKIARLVLLQNFTLERYKINLNLIFSYLSDFMIYLMIFNFENFVKHTVTKLLQ